jgi:hypothetical protein
MHKEIIRKLVKNRLLVLLRQTQFVLFTLEF